MLSANINLAMLCLRRSAKASAQAGCNCNFSKRYYLTLAMQQFSNLLSPTGTNLLYEHVYHAYQASQRAAKLSWSYSCLLRRGQVLPPHPTQRSDTPCHFPGTSTSMATACPASQTSRKLCCSSRFLFASLGKPQGAQSQLPVKVFFQLPLLTLGPVETPCCYAHRLCVAMPQGGGKCTTFLLWSAHSLTQNK